MFDTFSAIATPIAVRATGACKLSAAGRTNGPCTAQCPPALGINSVMISELR